MSRLPSITARLSWLLVGTALVWGLLVSGLVWMSVGHEVDELLDQSLRESALVLVGLLASEEGLAANGPARVAQRPEATMADSFAWQVVGAGSRVLLRSARAPEAPLMPLPTYGFANASNQWRVFGVRFSHGERVLYVAQTRAERLEAQAGVSASAVLATVLVALLSAVWLRHRIARELQPVTSLAATLGRYEPLQPQAALEAPTRAELVPIHHAIDELGQRLALRVANERAFSAHAAHALRTPLAGIDAQLAMALRECPPELRARLQRVREAAGRLTRVVSALLALFRSGVELQWRAVDLDLLLSRLPVEGIEVRLLPGPSTLQADADLLTAALLNLLDNAIRHGARLVQLQLHHDGDQTRLRVDDDGCGATPAQRADLRDALARQAYEGHMGLGLMLADLVARAHGGALALPETAAGFAAELHWPRFEAGRKPG